MKIYLDESDEQFKAGFIGRKTGESLTEFTGDGPKKLFTLSIENETQEIVAGITGFIKCHYAIVDSVWTHESYRKQGLGRQLFERLESYAIDHKVSQIFVDTFGPLAKPFYEKLGFQLIGTVEKWLNGYDLYFFRKDLNLP